MKIKTLVLAFSLGFSMNSFAATNVFKWCGENRGKCAAGVIGTISLVAGAAGGYYYLSQPKVGRLDMKEYEKLADFIGKRPTKEELGKKLLPNYLVLNQQVKFKSGAQLAKGTKFYPSFQMDNGFIAGVIDSSDKTFGISRDTFTKSQLAQFSSFFSKLPTTTYSDQGKGLSAQAKLDYNLK